MDQFRNINVITYSTTISRSFTTVFNKMFVNTQQLEIISSFTAVTKQNVNHYKRV